MLWFKHYNKAAEGESFERLLAERDFETAYVYWWLLEQVSKFEDKSDPNMRGRITLNFAYFKRKLHLNFQRTSRVLKKITKTFDLEVVVESDESIRVFVPNWLDLQENRGGKRKAKENQKEVKNGQEERGENKIKKEEHTQPHYSVEPQPFHPLIQIWNSSTKLGKVLKTNPTRNKKINAIYEKLSREEWEKVVKKIEESDFCLGKGSTGWKANFDWLLRPETYLKVLEGNYDNKGQRQTNFEQRSIDEQQREFDSIVSGQQDDDSGLPPDFPF